MRYYGKWMRDEAEKRIGHLYPKVRVIRGKDGSYRHATEEEVEAWSREQEASIPASRSSLPAPIEERTVIAWLWARTVKSPNPAFAHVDVPLISTYMLSTKSGKEAYVEPVVENGRYRFTVKVGKPKDLEAAKKGSSAGKRGGFLCLMSGTPLTYGYVREEGSAGRMGARLMAIVVEGDRGRVYLTPTSAQEEIARGAKQGWKPDTPLYGKCRVNVSNYGLDTYGDLFTPRQLVALTTFSDLVGEAREMIRNDAIAGGMPDDGKGIDSGGTGATAYAEAVGVYLGFGVDYAANYWSVIATPADGFIRGTFASRSFIK